MQELRCPHCGEVFQVDETGYAQLARQVRDSEFDKELRRREQELLARQESELDLARLRQEQAYQKTLRDKDEALAQSAREAERLRERLESSETEKKLAVAEAVQRQAQALSEGEKRILTLENELAVAFPFLIGIIVGLVVQIENQAGHYQLLLGTIPSRIGRRNAVKF